MEKLDQLFNEAKSIFGFEGIITAAIQNRGCLKKQEDIDKVFDECDFFIRKSELKLVALRSRVWSFKNELKKAFINGEL